MHQSFNIRHRKKAGYDKTKPPKRVGLPIPLQILQMEVQTREIHRIRLSGALSPAFPRVPISRVLLPQGGPNLHRPLGGGPSAPRAPSLTSPAPQPPPTPTHPAAAPSAPFPARAPTSQRRVRGAEDKRATGRRTAPGPASPAWPAKRVLTR